MQPSLPVDILRDIVDQLSNDPVSLQACSLTSCTLSHATRIHLFKEIYVRSLHNGRRFSDFLSFLHDSPFIYTFIRRIKLTASVAHGFTTQVPSRLLQEILSLLPSLISLELCDVSFAGPYCDVSEAPKFALQHVRFTDVGGQADTISDWTRILSVFSSIGELCVQAELPNVLHLPYYPLPCDAQISTLKLRGVSYLGNMLEYFKTTLSNGFPSTLEISLLVPRHVPSLGSYLSEQQSIKRLRLDLSNFRTDQALYHASHSASLWSSLQLSTLHSLQFLTFTITFDPSVSISLAHVSEILTSSCPPYLHSLTIIATGFFRPILPIPDSDSEQTTYTRIHEASLESLDRVVVAGRLKDLESVVMDLSGASCTGVTNVVSVRRYVEQCMPELARKDMLRVLPPQT